MASGNSPSKAKGSLYSIEKENRRQQAATNNNTQASLSSWGAMSEDVYPSDHPLHIGSSSYHTDPAPHIRPPQSGDPFRVPGVNYPSLPPTAPPRSTTGRSTNQHVFNIPKPGQSRPEHHRHNPQSTTVPRQRDTTGGGGPTQPGVGGFINPLERANQHQQRSKTSRAPVPIEIPTAPATYTTPAAPPELFSARRSGSGGFRTINDVWKEWDVKRKTERMEEKRRNGDSDAEDDSEDERGGFDVNAAASQTLSFGAPDPYQYVDSGQAQENIKALLEGAFDDGETKTPRARRARQTKAKPKSEPQPDDLADQLGAMSIKKDDERDGSSATIATGAPNADRVIKEGVEEDEEEEEDDGSVEGLKIKLLPHQIEGVDWMLDRELGTRKKNGVLPHGGILADDMGLGKTVQAVALILSNPRPSKEKVAEDQRIGDQNRPNNRRISRKVNKGTLVIAPLALIRQWETEIHDKVDRSPPLRVLVHHGPSRTKSAAELKKYDVVITTYQILATEHERCTGEPYQVDDGKVGCFGVHWYRIIADEGHTIKNRNAKMTKACYALNSHYRWCLTGTPMQNNLDELQSLIHFLQIKPYNNIHRWKTDITGLMKSGRGVLAMQRVQYFLSAFMKRRTKDVLKKGGALKAPTEPMSAKGSGSANGNDDKGGAAKFQIVARRVEHVEVELSSEERAFYDKLADRAKARIDAMVKADKNDYIGALVLVLRLRQACNHRMLVSRKASKAAAVIEAGGSPSNASASKTDGRIGGVEALANMMGGLSVDSNNKKTTKAKKEKRSKDKNRKNGKSSGEKLDTARLRAAKNRRTILDSDDEDEDAGEWLVEGAARPRMSDMGVAGDTDDENAEGGGRWLESDSDSDSELSYEDDDGDSSSGEDSDGSQSNPINLEEDDGALEFHGKVARGEIPSDLSSTKIDALLSILRHEIPNHKVIVFSAFTSMLDLIEPLLTDFLEDFQATDDGSDDPNPYNYVRYDGTMRPPAREHALHTLRTSPSTRILLCSLKCGSLGLNLTAASRVVLLEPFWNPFVEEQAIDRVHRLNQTVDVVVHKITVADTIEQRILELQAAKRLLATQTVEKSAVGAAAADSGEGDGAQADAQGKLSMRDVMRLFSNDAGAMPSIVPTHVSAPVVSRAVGSYSPSRNNGGGAGGGRGKAASSYAAAQVAGTLNPYTDASFWNGGGGAAAAAPVSRVGHASKTRREDEVYGRR